MLDEICLRLSSHRPTTVAADGRRRAAVAVVFRDGSSGPEVLFIERSRQEGDPWSGHMAFPGGRVDPGDRDTRQAAERETEEEVSLSLSSARYLGQLDDLEGRHVGPRAHMVISAHVYHHPDPTPVVLNREVEQAIWFPVSGFLDPKRHVEFEVANGDRFPGILVGIPERHVVWGLTYRFIEVLMRIAGQPIPERWIQARPPAPDGR